MTSWVNLRINITLFFWSEEENNPIIFNLLPMKKREKKAKEKAISEDMSEAEDTNRNYEETFVEIPNKNQRSVEEEKSN